MALVMHVTLAYTSITETIRRTLMEMVWEMLVRVKEVA